MPVSHVDTALQSHRCAKRSRFCSPDKQIKAALRAAGRLWKAAPQGSAHGIEALRKRD